jgi:UDP-N-acetylmuramate dehydrogenase
MSLRMTPDASLRWLNTFGVRARARLLAVVGSTTELAAALAYAQAQSLPVVVLGGGSNVLLLSDLDAVVVVPRIPGLVWSGLDDGRVHVRVGAGENWHEFVQASLAAGACGLENLALIPGTVGAAPIQNIGAYGVELDRFVHAVEVYDRMRGGCVRLYPHQCEFSYRDSLFKRDQGERYIVTAVEFALLPAPELALDYAGVREELQRNAVIDPTALDVFDAVCAIRRRKLPDPAVLGNAGSFFKNPIVPNAQADALRAQHPQLPIYAVGVGLSKLAAAWLIERCGWKGRRIGDAGVHGEHALVLINHGGATGAQILALAQAIQGDVRERFGVDLEPEPRVLGSSS